MDENDPLEDIAAELRKEGFEVEIRPDSSRLPAFFENAEVDLLAWKGNNYVAYRLNAGTEPDELDAVAVRVSADADMNYALNLLRESESLLAPDTMRAALLIGWAALEAAVRWRFRDELDTDRATGRRIADALREHKLIDRDGFAQMLHCMYLRNVISHGVKPDYMSSDSVVFLLQLVRQILEVSGSEFSLRLNGSLSAVILRSGVNKLPKIKHFVEAITSEFYKALGPSRARASIEWDLAEDAQSKVVVVLKMSDPTGTMTATFLPSELGDKAHMLSRMNRLWGDLLQVRSHIQLERLFGSGAMK